MASLVSHLALPTSFPPPFFPFFAIINTGEVLRLNPFNLPSKGFVLAYDIDLQGTGVGGGLATLDLGNPANGTNLPFTVPTTTGMLASTFVNNLASQIDTVTSSTGLFATPMTTANGVTLLISGPIDNGSGNNYIDFGLTDLGFTYDYGITAVPEPSSALMACIGALTLSGYAYWCRRRRSAS
jgi:hypothetical protein